MTKTLADARLVPCNPLPRYVRRIIHDTELCHYQREEYRTAPERNLRFADLRGIAGLVKYSDSNSAGIIVYVVAWPREHNADEGNGRGMMAANRKTTGGPPYLPPSGNCKELPSDSISMELDVADHGKSEISESESDSI